MIAWLVLFGLFGLVAYEQMSLVPLIVPSILFVIGYPMTSRLTRTAKAGGKGTGDINWMVILLVIPVVLAILSTWRGGGQ